MKKVIARKGALIYLAPGVAFVPMTVYFLMRGIMTANLPSFGWAAVFAFLSGYSFFYVNRYAAIVGFDGKVFIRRGFFGGFQSSCELAKVRHFATGTVFKEGLYLFVIEDAKPDRKRLDPGSKNGYICFKLTAANKALLDMIDPASIVDLDKK